MGETGTSEVVSRQNISKAKQKEVSKALLRKTTGLNNRSFLVWSIFIQLHHLATAQSSLLPPKDFSQICHPLDLSSKASRWPPTTYPRQHQFLTAQSCTCPQPSHTSQSHCSPLAAALILPDGSLGQEDGDRAAFGEGEPLICQETVRSCWGSTSSCRPLPGVWSILSAVPWLASFALQQGCRRFHCTAPASNGITSTTLPLTSWDFLEDNATFGPGLPSSAHADGSGRNQPSTGPAAQQPALRCQSQPLLPAAAARHLLSKSHSPSGSWLCHPFPNGSWNHVRHPVPGAASIPAAAWPRPSLPPWPPDPLP